MLRPATFKALSHKACGHFPVPVTRHPFGVTGNPVTYAQTTPVTRNRPTTQPHRNRGDRFMLFRGVGVWWWLSGANGALVRFDQRSVNRRLRVSGNPSHLYKAGGKDPMLKNVR